MRNNIRVTLPGDYSDNPIVATISNDLLEETAVKVREQLSSTLSAFHRNCILNLSSSINIDLRGLNALLQLKKIQEENNRELLIISKKDSTVYNYVKSAGADKILALRSY